MLELVFVIVVIGILAAAIIPRMERETLYEASEQLLSHVKYTQHLAMTDNMFDNGNANWFDNRWKIDFTGNTYAITSNTTNALDPLSRAAIDGSGDYDLNTKYTVQITTADYVLAFDHLGRPYGDGIGGTPTANLLAADKNITISSNGETATITITAETGFSYLTFN